MTDTTRPGGRPEHSGPPDQTKTTTQGDRAEDTTPGLLNGSRWWNDEPIEVIDELLPSWKPQPEPDRPSRIQRYASIPADLKPIGPFYTPAQLLAKVGNWMPTWVAYGFLALQTITELDARTKIGKTTLILDLMRCILDGTPFGGKGGYITRKGRIVYVTEMQNGPFLYQLHKAGLDERTEGLRVLFREDFHGHSWPEIVARVHAEADELGAETIVVDTLSKLAGIREENAPADWNDAIEPLQDAASHNHAILNARHSVKANADVGLAGRGSGAAAGESDIILDLRRLQGYGSGGVLDNQRLLQSEGRFDETPNGVILELVDSVYVLRGDQHLLSKAAFAELALEAVTKLIANNKGTPTTIRDVFDDLKKAGHVQGDSDTKTRTALKELTHSGRLIQFGGTSKTDPLRFTPTGHGSDGARRSDRMDAEQIKAFGTGSNPDQEGAPE